MKSSKLFFLLFALLVVSTSLGTAQWGNCAGFDGGTSYISTSASSSIAVPTAVTIEAWIKPSHTGNCQEVIRLRGAGYDDGCEIQIQDYDGSVQFNANLPTDNNNWCTAYSLSSVNVFDGAWHHVAGVVDGSNNAYLYVDGVFQDNTTGSGHIALDGYGYVYIGMHPTADGGDYYCGLIDEVRISNSVRYSSNFTPSTLPFTTDVNTLVLFHFNESNGTTTADASGKGNAGTLNNGAFFFTGFAAGDGSSGNPYQVVTAYQLNQVRAFPSAYFRQMADIDLNASPYKDGDGWSPIGSSTTNFIGTYNGNGHTITNLYINRSLTEYIGLFGYIGSGATVCSLGVIANTITGQNHTGVFAGWNSGTVDLCYTQGTVTGATSVGGFIAENGGGTINRSYSSVTTNGSDDVGAFVGDNTIIGSISYCYATGNSSGGTDPSNYTSGGLVGWNDGASNISNCYATGNAIGNDLVGGLVGSNDGTVSNCYAIGTVTGDVEGYVGGYAGVSSGTDADCFYNKEIFTGSTSYGTGKTTAEMQTASTFLDAGWSGSIWNIDSTKTINNGYPYLKWKNTSGTPIPVELTSFTATTDNLNAKLSWKTATEVNNYGFDIERRLVETVSSKSQTSTLNWSKIGFVQGNGTSNSPKEYSYTDASVASGTYAYRLKQIDNKGAFKYLTRSRSHGCSTKSICIEPELSESI